MVIELSDLFAFGPSITVHLSANILGFPFFGDIRFVAENTLLAQ